jgi:hypothetical protein
VCLSISRSISLSTSHTATTSVSGADTVFWRRHRLCTQCSVRNVVAATPFRWTLELTTSSPSYCECTLSEDHSQITIQELYSNFSKHVPHQTPHFVGERALSRDRLPQSFPVSGLSRAQNDHFFVGSSPLEEVTLLFGVGSAPRSALHSSYAVWYSVPRSVSSSNESRRFLVLIASIAGGGGWVVVVKARR